MEGGVGYPSSPGQSSSAADLPNKGVAVKEDEPDKNKSEDDSGDDVGGNGQGPQGAQAATSSSGTGSRSREVREEDRLMPIANINRIMRKALPTRAKIAEDAKATVQQCVFEFMGYITADANERCRLEQRKTITAEDMLWAFSKRGFHEYANYLTPFLHRYRLGEGANRPARRDLLAEAARAAAATTSAAGLQPAPRLDAGSPGYPAGLFTDLGGSSSVPAAAAAAAGAGGRVLVMPQDYQRDVAGTQQAGPSQQGPAQMFGFDPFPRYN